MSHMTRKVYGYDSFSSEDYLIGEFETEADECVSKCEKQNIQSQDESLQDNLWITVTWD